MAATCPVCGSENVDLWLGGLGAGTARAWIASTARAWYHCRECNYLGRLREDKALENGQHENYGSCEAPRPDTLDTFQEGMIEKHVRPSTFSFAPDLPAGVRV